MNLKHYTAVGIQHPRNTIFPEAPPCAYSNQLALTHFSDWTTSYFTLLYRRATKVGTYLPPRRHCAPDASIFRCAGKSIGVSAEQCITGRKLDHLWLLTSTDRPTTESFLPPHRNIIYRQDWTFHRHCPRYRCCHRHRRCPAISDNRHRFVHLPLVSMLFHYCQDGWLFGQWCRTMAIVVNVSQA